MSHRDASTYVEAPHQIPLLKNEEGKPLPRVFLAGGITGCSDWQAKVAERLVARGDCLVMNPRRENFPIDDPSASEQQIRWEYEALNLADVVLFWFPCETLCPITLYELGRMFGKYPNGPLLVVGAHPDYKRLTDIRIQGALVSPVFRPHTDLDKVVAETEVRIDKLRELFAIR